MCWTVIVSILGKERTDVYVALVVFKTRKQKGSQPIVATLLYHCLIKLSILEKVLYRLVGHHSLIENISTSLRTTNHFDNLCICATVR